MNLNLIEQVGRQNLRHVVPDVNSHVFSRANIKRRRRSQIKKVNVQTISVKECARKSWQGPLTWQHLQSRGHPYPSVCGPVGSLWHPAWENHSTKSYVKLHCSRHSWRIAVWTRWFIDTRMKMLYCYFPSTLENATQHAGTLACSKRSWFSSVTSLTAKVCLSFAAAIFRRWSKSSKKAFKNLQGS